MLTDYSIHNLVHHAVSMCDRSKFPHIPQANHVGLVYIKALHYQITFALIKSSLLKAYVIHRALYQYLYYTTVWYQVKCRASMHSLVEFSLDETSYN